MTQSTSNEPPTGARRAWRAIVPWLWPVVKGVLTVAVIVAVGWEFARVLRQSSLWARPLHLPPANLVAAATLYLTSQGFPALFWYWLLRALGQQPPIGATLRAYYVGQLGRYVPGKVVGLVMRARLLSGPRVRLSVAIMTVVYEVLTTIASGTLLALVTIAPWTSGSPLSGWRVPVLLAILGCVLLPTVFNKLVVWIAHPFRTGDEPPLPRVRVRTLLVGLLITGAGWFLQGGTLWLLVVALVPDAWQSPLHGWSRCTAYVALAYAAGFLVLTAPGGLGVRDLVIQQFLAADLAPSLGDEAAEFAVLAAVLIRLLWVVIDVAAAALCYWLPHAPGKAERRY